MTPVWRGAFIAMMPRIQAERSLAHVREIMAADPGYTVDSRQAQITAWEEQVGVEPPKAPPADLMLALMGIEVRYAPRQPAQEGRQEHLNGV